MSLWLSWLGIQEWQSGPLPAGDQIVDVEVHRHFVEVILHWTLLEQGLVLLGLGRQHLLQHREPIPQQIQLGGGETGT